MGSERAEQDQQRANSLNRSLFDVSKRVYINHHLRDRGIERECLDILSYFLDCRVDYSELLSGRLDLTKR